MNLKNNIICNIGKYAPSSVKTNQIIFNCNLCNNYKDNYFKYIAIPRCIYNMCFNECN